MSLLVDLTHSLALRGSESEMNFGLIGAGQIGRVRAKAIRRAAGCELTAITDAEPARARSLAASAQAAVCTNYEELPRREDVDAVIISTPPDSPGRAPRPSIR